MLRRTLKEKDGDGGRQPVIPVVVFLKEFTGAHLENPEGLVVEL
jgi:hypothetical protein